MFFQGTRGIPEFSVLFCMQEGGGGGGGELRGEMAILGNVCFSWMDG